MSCHGCVRCLAQTCRSSSSGRVCTVLHPFACARFGSVVCSLRATPRTAFRHLVHEVPTPGCRTLTTLPGSSPTFSTDRPETRCWIRTVPSGSTPPTENIRHSTRSTNFISPPTEISRVFRDAVLGLARDNDFARTLVNTGRLSTATVLHESPLNTPDVDSFAGDLVPGAPAMDAPVATAEGPSWLLRHVVGGAFTLLIADGPHLADRVRALLHAAEQIAPVHVVGIATSTTGGRAALDVVNSGQLIMLVDAVGAVERRYDMRPGTAYLLRPDQHVCARWRTVEPRALCHAMRRALALH